MSDTQFFVTDTNVNRLHQLRKELTFSGRLISIENGEIVYDEEE